MMRVEYYLGHVMKMTSLIILALALLSGCTIQSPTLPANIQSYNANERAGAETARQLTERYNDRAANCGSASLAAFLCSGIIFRATKAGSYHVWDPYRPSSDSSASSPHVRRLDL